MGKNIRMFLTEKSSLIVQIVMAFLGTYGICYLCKTAGMDKASYSVFSVMYIIVLMGLWNRTRKSLAEPSERKEKRRRIVFAAVVSFLFAMSMIMGYQLQNNGITDGGVRGKGMIVLRSLCLSVAVFPFGNYLFQKAEGIGRVSDKPDAKVHPAAIFGICSAVIFICLIPVWLAYYPIIMSYEFHRQVNEAYKGLAYFYPYQPIAHTWVIWAFLQLGKMLGSFETGFACMALFQMLLYALVTGYACSMVYRIVKRKWAVIGAALFFGVFPFHTVMVVCTTKDILFTVLFLLFFLLLLERSLFFTEGRKRVWIDVLLVLEGSLMVQFRNNAFYAVAVFMVLFVLLVPKKEKLRILLLGILLIVGSKTTEFMIKKAIGTELNSSRVEMFSVPIQQLARVGYYHGSELDEFTALELDSYIPWQEWENYYPPLADTVKNSVNTEKFEENYHRLFSLWARLGLQYPNEYLDAFLELTRGYWFPDDVSWSEYLGYGVEGRMGAVFTYTSSEIEGVGSVLHESKFPWLETQLEKIVSGNAFYNWPVISVLFRCSFYTWGLFLITMLFIYRRQKVQLKLSLLLWLYFGTMLLGPVAQLRYVFPIMVQLPLLLAMLCLQEKHDNEEPGILQRETL